MKLIVIFGGPSPEHEVSLASAASVLKHSRELGWDILAAGVSKHGDWLVGPGALERLVKAADPGLLPVGLRGGSVSPDDPVEVFGGPPPAERLRGWEVALPLCHGRWGEDGALQGLLLSYGLRIVGCSVAASAVCFDKHLARSVLSAAGLPVAAGLRIQKAAYEQDPDGAACSVTGQLGPGPWFVKPVRGGSSLGVGLVSEAKQLASALDAAYGWDDAALVERAVRHRELVVGVVGSSRLTVSPPGECRAVGALYTYEEKYRLGNPRFLCPAPLSSQQSARVRELATETFLALGCEVFARVDLFLDLDDSELLVNEVNTIPGMTEVSVFPKVMAAAGFSYPKLLEALCRQASGS